MHKVSESLLCTAWLYMGSGCGETWECIDLAVTVIAAQSTRPRSLDCFRLVRKLMSSHQRKWRSRNRTDAIPSRRPESKSSFNACICELAVLSRQVHDGS